MLLYTAAYIYVVANKKKIIGQIRQEVAAKLNGQVSIGNIDLGFFSNFPGIAVELENVVITDTLFNKHKHPFFQAGQVKAGISVINLIKKTNPLTGITIEDGELYIYTDTLGYTNSYLLSPKNTRPKPKGPPAKNEIEKIKFRNVRLVLDDQLKQK